MATAGEEEVEYESDPEEAKRALAMRRREAASDDEESEEREDGKPGSDRRGRIHSDESDDDQGGVAEYDDEEEYIEEYDEELEDEEGYADEGYEEDYIEGEAGEEGKAEERNVVREGNGGKEVAAKDSDDYRRDGESHEEVEGDDQLEEKKENEPFAVPTAGAFYMHDDRFRDNAAGRPRRFHGGRKLWESKDDRKWGHDKFEEMNMQERQYDERRRTSRGRYRGRGRGRGAGRGYGRESRSKSYDNTTNQNQAPKGVRGRGPRRYEPTGNNNNQESSTLNKQSMRPSEKNPQTVSGRGSTPATNVDSDPTPARKQVFASSLNSASPPFYPSSTTNREIGLTQKRDTQTTNNRNFRHSVMSDNMTVPQNNTSLRGKNVVDNVGMEKLYINDSIPQASGKPMANFPVHPSGSSMSSTTQSSQSRVQGKGIANTGQVTYVPSHVQNQGNRVPVPSPAQNIQRNHAPSRVPASAQQMGQHPSSGSKASSPPNSGQSLNSPENAEPESLSESNKSKGALVGKGKSNVGSGKGSFFYGGAQVMGAAGNMGVGQGDQSFPAPTFLPVMQFGGQHPSGIGVPAVGMAFPGYVAQPHGMGSSEMTWLPVLAGAAGALGATYCSPYLAVDGAYQARPAGQTSSMAPSNKDTNKPDNELKPSQRHETANEESGQRQNKPRRYSEMNFAP